MDPAMTLADRAMSHRALGDEARLAIVDALALSDHSPSRLAELTGMSTNLLAFHLNVLEGAGLIERTVSQGDARRRYVTLVRSTLSRLAETTPLSTSAQRVVFVCTANSARSQLAAQLWHARTRRPALSAGAAPAEAIHPTAVEVARRHGLDLAGVRPIGYAELDVEPDLVVSVCDRAHESALPFEAPLLHWSVPDPVPGDLAVFASTFELIADRVDHLARATRAA